VMVDNYQLRYRSPKDVDQWKCAYYIKVTDGGKCLLLPLIGNKDHSTTEEGYPSNVHTGEQSSASTRVNNEGSLWDSPWSANDTVILYCTNPETKKSSDVSVSQTSDLKIIASKATDSIIMYAKKFRGNFVLWGTTCSVTMSSPLNDVVIQLSRPCCSSEHRLDKDEEYPVLI